MPTLMEMERRLGTVFSGAQVDVLSEMMHEARSDNVTTSDFSELKAIVQDLADAQRRTEIKVGELVEAQKRTEAKVLELAESQNRTEAAIRELTEAQKRSELDTLALAGRIEQTRTELVGRIEQTRTELVGQIEQTKTELGDRIEQTKTELGGQIEQTRAELGGLSRSFSYAFENEAYRMIPEVLRKTHGIDLHDRMIRAEIANHEINLLGRGTKDGQDIVVVGESKVRLDDRRQRGERDVFDELAEKIAVVKTEYGTENVVGLLTTHFATKKMLKRAEEEGVLVLQSFEW